MIRKTKYNLHYLTVYNSRAPDWMTNLIDTIAEEVHPDIADELRLASGKALKNASETSLEEARHKICYLRLERILGVLRGEDWGFVTSIKAASDLHYKCKNNPYAWYEVHTKLNLQYLHECNKLKVQDRLWAKAALKCCAYTQSTISESAICCAMFFRGRSETPNEAFTQAWSEEVKSLEGVLKMLQQGDKF